MQSESLTTFPPTLGGLQDMVDNMVANGLLQEWSFQGFVNEQSRRQTFAPWKRGGKKKDKKDSKTTNPSTSSAKPPKDKTESDKVGAVSIKDILKKQVFLKIMSNTSFAKQIESLSWKEIQSELRKKDDAEDFVKVYYTLTLDPSMHFISQDGETASQAILSFFEKVGITEKKEKDVSRAFFPFPTGGNVTARFHSMENFHGDDILRPKELSAKAEQAQNPKKEKTPVGGSGN
jgi:hypothetical protein